MCVTVCVHPAGEDLPHTQLIANVCEDEGMVLRAAVGKKKRNF